MISTTIKKLELKDVWTISRNSSRFKENVFIELQNDGITAYGEAAPNVRYGESAQQTKTMIQAVAEEFFSLDVADDRRVKDWLDNRIVRQNCAAAALDMTAMDWLAKKRNQPLYRLLGLGRHQPMITSYSIGIDNGDVIEQKIHRAADFPVLKIKVGRPDDEAIIETVRRVTDKPIRVDANEGWTDKETAVRKIEWLQSQNVEFVEQPMPANMPDETAWLKARVSIPLIADEAVLNASDIPALADIYDGINIKLMKAGGIRHARTMIETARRFGLKVMIGCMIESSLAVTAAAHLAPLADWIDLDGHLLIENDPFRGATVSRGRLILDDQPGIGATETR